MPTTKHTAQRENPPYSTSPLLAQLDCVEHGFFGTRGGVSEAIYTSLNCGYSSQDLPERILENRGRVAACFDLEVEKLFSLRQVHSARVIELGADTPPQFSLQADGMVSATPGVGLGPLGADCAPVLFVDPVARVVGAAHSGWKGALTGINEAVIEKMRQLGASLNNIHAAIGPAMQVLHYEVQADFREMFERQSPIDSGPFFERRAGQLYFDTPAYVRARLGRAGVEAIDISTEDTYSQPDHYFSYRRSRQRGEDDYGRQIAVITLRD